MLLMLKLTIYKELEEALDKERMLKEELRVITNEINDLDQQIIWIEERKQVLKKVNQQEFKEQRKLSMLASVTNIIPDLNDELEISGHIVDRDKKVLEKFAFDPTKMTSYDICDNIWKMINKR